MPPQTRAAFRPLVFLFLYALVSGVFAASAAADQVEEQSIHRFKLQADLAAFVDNEGGLVILPSGSRSPLLQTELVSLTDSRRRRPSDSFHKVVGEGVVGGHHGFSSRADDDRDGRIDEDPLDGRDNDQDGRIDEDFAAISDAMVAVHLGRSVSGDRSGDGGVQLEYYHWGHSSLGSTVFLNAGGAAGEATYRLTTSGSAWQETGINFLLHSVIGRPARKDPVALVSRVSLVGRLRDDDPCTAGTGLWLGVMILDDDSATRFLLEEDRLDLPLGKNPVPLAVCAAESWLQLNRIMGEAQRLYEGMTDPVDNRRAHWIVPPACSMCRSADAPGFDFDRDAEGRSILSADIVPGQCGLLDPDLFRIDGRLLGAPREIRWQPAKGMGATIPWSCSTADHLRDGSLTGAGPYLPLAGLLNHQARGRLEFFFDTPANIPADPLEISGRYLDGHPFRTNLQVAIPKVSEGSIDPAASPAPEFETVDEVARGFAEDRARLLNADRHHLSLSPDLLMGWPNPFNDVISIRFTVPGTMREAFVWKDEGEQPTEINLEGAVPWPGGQPGVSVKIYSINGQELVTLHSATLGAGDYTAQWNGTDAFGRKVASGTYFCKLQLDDWSVTRRLVFIR
ncbi:MAG: FlgD immunoglobulin-like domain containing protein [Candidatus Krumholzibacteriota bacterium]